MSYVDATPTREHIARLNAWGMKNAMIADATSGWVNNSTVCNIAKGRYPRIVSAVEADILAVTPHPHPHARLALSVGAQRRIRALQRRGWPLPELDKRLGVPEGTCSQILLRPKIARDLWQRIADLYEPLSALQEVGPSPRTLAYAIKKKWPAPLDWETADIDHPDSWPEPARNHKRRDYDAIANRRAQVAELTRCGLSAADIAARMRVSTRTIEYDRSQQEVA